MGNALRCLMSGCNIAVIGASTGGIEAVQDLLEELPESLEAAILVVIHIPDIPSILPNTLARKSRLPVRFARDGEHLQHGQVLVAPPNHHLLVAPGDVARLAQTARENGFRPAVDPLFRSAALAAGPRVMGIVLSGALDDGAAGLLEIVRRGGRAVVQDFEEALFPSMPRAAAQQARTAQVLPLHEIALLVTKFASEAPHSGSAMSESEDALAVGDDSDERVPTDLSCPQCGGVLRASNAVAPMYSCHVGHTYAPEALAAHQSSEVDRALWSAIRVLKESAALHRGNADRAVRIGLGELSEAYERRALEAEEKAENIRRVCEAPRAQ